MVGKTARWEESKLKTALAVSGIIIVALASVWAIATVGLPSTARMKEFDDARVSDLSSLHSAIERFYDEEGKLPVTLTELDIGDAYLQDPENEESYGYVVDDSRHYRLSSRFALANQEHRHWYGQNWSHEAGVQEFTFEVEEKKRE